MNCQSFSENKSKHLFFNLFYAFLKAGVGIITSYVQLRGMAEKFVDTISIFNRKISSVKMNISGFAKIFHEQIDEIL